MLGTSLKKLKIITKRKIFEISNYICSYNAHKRKRPNIEHLTNVYVQFVYSIWDDIIRTSFKYDNSWFFF